MQPTIDNTVTVFLRDQFSLWIVEFIIGSNTATAEVIPANNIAINNNGAIMWPIGPITLKILGKTTNTSPVPSLTNSTRGVPEV